MGVHLVGIDVVILKLHFVENSGFYQLRGFEI